MSVGFFPHASWASCVFMICKHCILLTLGKLVDIDPCVFVCSCKSALPTGVALCRFCGALQPPGAKGVGRCGNAFSV